MKYDKRVLIRESGSVEFDGEFDSISAKIAKQLLLELEPIRKEADHKYYSEHHLKEAVDSVNFWLQVLHPDLFDTDEAVKELYEWKPEYFQVSIDFKENGHYTEGDENAPFLSEKFLYNLLGKSDARTLLGLIKRALGTKGIKK
jgi:hypothetical protein